MTDDILTITEPELMDLCPGTFFVVSLGEPKLKDLWERCTDDSGDFGIHRLTLSDGVEVWDNTPDTLIDWLDGANFYVLPARLTAPIHMLAIHERFDKIVELVLTELGL